MKQGDKILKRKMSKLNKRKVVTFQLVNRSIEDPNNADPNASEHVLVPIHIGKDVDPELVESLKKQMTPEARKQDSGRKRAKKNSDGNRGIGAQYNKYFDKDLPDDGEDYSKYFKAIDEGDDDGVFVAPDGSVHDLREKKVENVDALVNKLGFTKDFFGTEVDPSLPKLVDDTLDPLASGIDPDVLLAMDDDNAAPLDDDFISKALDAEMGADDEEEDEEDDLDSVDGFDINGNSVKKTMSRVSATPSHMSHISHRSHAMDMQEQNVDYIVENVFREEEDYSDDDRDMGTPTDWKEIAEDMDSFDMHIKLNPVPKPPEGTVRPVMQEEEEKFEEEEEEKPKGIPLDIRSVTDFASTTDNLPSKIQDKSLAKKKRGKKHEEEEEIELPVAPDFAPKPGETKEEAKARKKAIKEYQRQKRALKKERKEKFAKAIKKVHKSIAASGGSRGQRVYNLD